MPCLFGFVFSFVWAPGQRMLLSLPGPGYLLAWVCVCVEGREEALTPPFPARVRPILLQPHAGQQQAQHLVCRVLGGQLPLQAEPPCAQEGKPPQEVYQ